MLAESERCAVAAIVTDLLPANLLASARERAARFRDSRVIASDKFPVIPFTGDGPWPETGNRAHDRFLHGFLFFADWLGSPLSDPGTSRIFSALALEIITDWIKQHASGGVQPPMAFHDEATAQRLIHLLALRPKLTDISQQQLQSIDEFMKETATLLSTDEFHATGNNHGMFQDIALLYYAVLTPTSRDNRGPDFMELALARLKVYFGSCFTVDGVHVENTPTYHLMVTRFVRNMASITAALSHPDAEFYAELHGRAARYATHAIMPNGVFPPISDTNQVELMRTSARGAFDDPGFAYAVSRGSSGDKPKERILLLPNSGYAIYRSEWGDPLATYVFFSAAYNADYHKHSDDLSLVVRSKGLDLLTEAGPYGYNYQDPLTRYAYSQFAHNSLIVDGRSLPRADGKHKDVGLEVIESDGPGITVRGTNSRHAGTVHRRQIQISESGIHPEIDVDDTVESAESHDYEILWHIGSEVTPVLHGQGFELFHEASKVMDLFFEASSSTQLSIHRGQMKPKPMGWRFPAFGESEPSNVISVKFSGTNVSVATRIRLGSFTYTDRGILSGQLDWSRYEGDIPLNYLFVPGGTSALADKLVIVFSAIQSRGDFTYNYKATLDHFGVSVLYILDDFGDQGSYYHSDHRATTIFETVQALIRSVMQENNILLDDVCTVGSSKGGTSAIIIGATMGVGRIIVGAPQVKIGTFTSGPHPNILRFMAGGTTESDIDYLDQIVFNASDSLRESTKLSILVGEQDHHLEGHVRPLVERMKSKGQSASLLVLPNLKHNDIGQVYRHFLSANIYQWQRGSSEEALPYSYTFDSRLHLLRLQVFPPAGAQIAFHLYQGARLYKRYAYSARNRLAVQDLATGRYRIRVYSRIVETGFAQNFTTEFLLVPLPDTSA